jgi:UDP-GlcNAc:undecaprenyl-phosphate GlcNAc-1-phosphate transferase
VIYFLPFTFAFIISLFMVPMVRWLGFKTGRVSTPRADRWHRQPTPSLGGVGMFTAFALGLLATGLLYRQPTGHWNLLVGALVMFVLGVYDDFKRISPPIKLGGQLLAATLFIAAGDTIDFFPWPIANILLTYFWLVGISNAINLLDNMDGLSGGVSLIAALMLTYFNARTDDVVLAQLSLLLAGSILGFLVFNFPPARIFMGDSGSMFLGFTLAALAVARRTQASSVLAIMGVPVMLFLLPILDTTLVTITRLLRGQSPAQGGTDHTSHRLVAFGLSERQAVLLLYGVAIVAGISATFLEARNYTGSLVLTPIVLIVFSLFAAYLSRLKVVTAAPLTVGGGLAQRVVNLAYRRRLFELLLDLPLIGVSYYLAYWVSYGLNMTPFSMGLFRSSWPMALGCAYLMFFLLGVYRGIWRYAGVNELMRYAIAAALASVLTVLILRFILPGFHTSPDVFVLLGIFLFLGLAASRFSFQILDRVYHQHQPIPEGTQRVIFYGVGDSAELALHWLVKNPSLGYQPIGCLDDDPHHWGAQIHGVEVLGGLADLPRLLAQQKAVGLVLLMPSDDVRLSEQILPICRQQGLWVCQLKISFETLE